MKTRIAFLAFALAFGTNPLSAQGPLAPPGAPAPTMKTLQQIEPRTDVATLAGDANYHHIITASGSYYLSGNVEVTLAHGIDIRASRVTLDLGGFAVRRTSGAGGNGVELSTGLNSIAVKNGSISGFANGLSLVSNAACRLTRLHIQGGMSGIAFTQDCKGNLVLDCAISDTSGVGIQLLTGPGGGSGGSCNQNIVQRCTVTKTGGVGIDFDGSNTGAALGNAVLDSAISQTGQNGIRFTGGNAQMNGNTVSKCAIANPGGNGVELSAFVSFADGNLLSDLAISKAAANGVSVVSNSNGNLRGNLLQRLTISDPVGMNIKLEAVQGGAVSGNVVRDCVGRDSGAIGLEIDGGPTGTANFNRVEGNHFSRTPPQIIIGSYLRNPDAELRGELHLAKFGERLSARLQLRCQRHRRSHRHDHRHAPQLRQQ